MGGDRFANYLYARQWTRSGQPSLLSTGARREPVSDVSRCHGAAYIARDVPYRADVERWALEQATTMWNLEASDATLVENYTACFPVTTDGKVHARALACDGLPADSVFILNGLAGGGISLGPGAGEHVARLVGFALGMGDGPLQGAVLASFAPLGLAGLAGGAVVGASPAAAASPAPFALGTVVGEARLPSLSSLSSRSPLSAADCHWLRVSAFPRVTSLARDAKLSELTVSAEFSLAGPTATSMSVFELPPSESCSRYVSFESR